MSLISLENLLEPLTNKVHLVAIIMVVLVFALLRINGGGFSIRSIEAPRLHNTKQKRADDQALREQIRKAAVAPVTPGAVTNVGAGAKPPVTRAKREHFMDKLLREKKEAEEASAQAAAPPVRRKSQSVTQKRKPPTAEENLDDIERSLGLK